MIEGWTENENGNWVLLDNYGVEATVYRTEMGWRAIWNGADNGQPRRLKGSFDCPDEAMSAVEDAIEEGERSPEWSVPVSESRRTRKGDGIYRMDHGVTYSVKRARSGSFYAVNMYGQLLGQAGRPTWFPTETAARKAVNALIRGEGGWTWVKRTADAA